MDNVLFIKAVGSILVTVGIAIGTWFLGRKFQKALDRKESAIARQEEIKIIKEEISVTTLIENLYKSSIVEFTQRIDKLEEKNLDLEKKYGEMLLRNAILEERAETYEEKYNILEKEHNKLKVDYEKIHEENKEMRKEIDELKKAV